MIGENQKMWRYRAERGADKALLIKTILRDAYSVCSGTSSYAFGRQKFKRLSRHVFKFRCHSRAERSEFFERFLVGVGCADVLFCDHGRGRVRIRLKHAYAVAHRRRCLSKHAAELTAAEKTEPAARKNRFVCHIRVN